LTEYKMDGRASSSQFGNAYKKALDGVTVSPELKEKILSLPERKRKPAAIRIIRPIASVAACIAVVFAAVRLLPIGGGIEVAKDAAEPGQFSMTASVATKSTVTAETETVVTEEVYSMEAAAEAPMEEAIPEAVEEENGVMMAADEPLADGLPDDAGQKSSAQENGETSLRKDPYVLGEHTPIDEPAAISEDSLDDLPAEGGAGMVGIANPLVGYELLVDAEEALGWSVNYPTLPIDYTVTVIAGQTLHIEWQDETGESYFRAASADIGMDDISGDYTVYPADRTIDGIRLRGESADAYILISWQSGGFVYAYSTSYPMTEAEAVIFVSEIG